MVRRTPAQLAALNLPHPPRWGSSFMPTSPTMIVRNEADRSLIEVVQALRSCMRFVTSFSGKHSSAGLAHTCPISRALKKDGQMRNCRDEGSHRGSFWPFPGRE